jgi:ubiquinol-cytochrome c reductase iron-sulfur subunit
MASLSRSFASAIVNRSYTNAPASSAALKRVFQLSSSTSDDEHHQAHGSQPLFNAATKQRSTGGLINRSNVNGTKSSQFFRDLGSSLDIY